VVEEAPVRDLFANPRHPYTQGLLASIPTLGKGVGGRKRLQAIPGLVPSLLDLPPGCRFSDRCPLVVPECRAVEPELRQVTPQHRARCIFA
jgi:peptide/nickel transport system ATP-binding protein